MVTMMNVSVRELKSRLSAYLARVRRGETLIITTRRQPLAQLVPLPSDEISALPGVRWNGNKPSRFGEIRGKARLRGNKAARAVLKDRR